MVTMKKTLPLAHFSSALLLKEQLMTSVKLSFRVKQIHAPVLRKLHLIVVGVSVARGIAF